MVIKRTNIKLLKSILIKRINIIILIIMSLSKQDYTISIKLETGTVYPSWTPGFTLCVWWGPCCSFHFCFLCCIFFICLCTVSCVPNVASVFGLSLLDCPFVFLSHFFRNACSKSVSLRFSQFSGCWLILSVYMHMSFDFPFVRLFGVR
jgi:cytochrome c oxidase subunit IV